MRAKFLFWTTRVVRKISNISSRRGLFFADIRQIPPALSRARKSGRKPYILASVSYIHNSAGRVACHRLVHELNLAGYDAFSLGAVNPRWEELTLTKLGLFFLLRFSDSVVVYPEIVTGNPLEAKQVVRWVLNVPGHLGGEAKFDKNELIYTWSTDFYNTDRILSLDIVDRELFNSDNLPAKSGCCFYVGKGPLRGAYPIPFTDGMTQITNDWPATRSELADVLRRVNVLYTYDDLTMLALEALLCGCQVVVLPEFRELKIDDPLWDFTRQDHRAQLDRFIAETQSAGLKSE